jgi:Mg-chelatase subunit ChlD
MSNTSNHTRRGDRGVSELVGVVLLFGIVIAGSAMIFVSGTAVSDDVRAEGRVDAASSTFLEMDQSVQSLAQQRGNEGEAVSLGAVNPNKAEIRDTGQMKLWINGESDCKATMDLSALEYNDDRDTTIAYESGAIWKRTEAGLVTEKAPELGFREGSLQLQVVRMEGAVQDDDMTVNYNRTESINKTEEIRADLFDKPSCTRPETLKISVESDYYEGWKRHLESQFPGSNVKVDVDAKNVTVDKIDLNADYPVVDIPGPGTGEIVSAGSGDDNLDLGPSTLYRGGATGSDDSARYSGTVTFLGAEHATYGTDTITEDEEVRVDYTATYTETVDVDMTGTAEVEVTNRKWKWANITEDVPPLEVSFVIDESGSMDDTVEWERWRRVTKLDRAQSATRTFLDVMSDDEEHRASLIGYDEDTRVLQEFTQDQDAVESQIEYLNAGDSTDIPSAIEESVDQFEVGATEERNQVMLLLTDGKDKSDRNPVTVAQNQIPDGVTVYTIGVGNDVNDDVLRDVAAAGDEDSEYIKVEDPDDLESTFEEIAKDETTIPNKAWTETTVTKEVDVSATGENAGSDEITVERVIGPSEDVYPGDTVTVSGTKTAEASDVQERTVTVERSISGPNGTTTKPVTATVEVEFEGSDEKSISGEHEVTEDRTETQPTDTDVDVVTWPSVSMSLSNETDTIDLWSGANVNAPSDSVEPGSYENFWVDEGGEVSFDPSVRSCTDHTRTGETVTDGGTEYTQTECDDDYGPVDSESTNVQMFANGTEIDVPGSADWQTPLSEMLTVGGTQYFEMTDDGSMEATNLDSNQWIVVVNGSDTSGPDASSVVLLVELGESDDMTGKYLVNVEVTAVSAQSSDADDDDD